MEYKAITEEQMPLLPKRPYIHIPDCKRQILINKVYPNLSSKFPNTFSISIIFACFRQSQENIP